VTFNVSQRWDPGRSRPCVARAIWQITHDANLALQIERERCPHDNALVVSQALATARRLRAAPLMTEFAAATDDDPEGLECILELADQNMIGWTYGLSWRHGELRNLDPTKAAVLSRAYPRAIAGTPQSVRYDPRTGSFDLRYRPNHRITAPTIVYLPVSIAYPNGYSVAVSGARVVSSPGAPLLLLENAPRGTLVTVHVAPLPGPTSLPSLPACDIVTLAAGTAAR
jgi:endoglycosylceramidase